MFADEEGWKVNIEGAVAPNLADAARSLSELEARLSQPPMNLAVSPGWRDEWVRQLRDGHAVESGKVGFSLSGSSH